MPAFNGFQKFSVACGKFFVPGRRAKRFIADQGMGVTASDFPLTANLPTESVARADRAEQDSLYTLAGNQFEYGFGLRAPVFGCSVHAALQGGGEPFRRNPSAWDRMIPVPIMNAPLGLILRASRRMSREAKRTAKNDRLARPIRQIEDRTGDSVFRIPSWAIMEAGSSLSR